ncbi:hypothetical protein Dimus_009596 [Dionaea muscipula]
MDIFDSAGIAADESTHSHETSSTSRATAPSSSTIDAAADIFESTLTLDETNINHGHADGYSAGLALGLKDGYEVGLKHGFQMGEELGFYRGLVDVWASAIRVNPGFFSARVQRMVQQLAELLDKYPIGDPENEGVDEIKKGLRLKFRAVCATLGAKLEYDGYPRLSDDAQQDLVF